MSFWEKTKQGLKSGAEATKRGAKRLQYKNEIRIRRGKIREVKKSLGAPLFAAGSGRRLAAGRPGAQGLPSQSASPTTTHQSEPRP